MLISKLYEVLKLTKISVNNYECGLQLLTFDVIKWRKKSLSYGLAYRLI